MSDDLQPLSQTNYFSSTLYINWNNSWFWCVIKYPINIFKAIASYGNNNSLVLRKFSFLLLLY